MADSVLGGLESAAGILNALTLADAEGEPDAQRLALRAEVHRHVRGKSLHAALTYLAEGVLIVRAALAAPAAALAATRARFVLAEERARGIANRRVPSQIGEQKRSSSIFGRRPPDLGGCSGRGPGPTGDTPYHRKESDR